MDFDNLTIEELTNVLSQVNNALRVAREQERQTVEQRRAQIGQAINDLATLLGPAEGEAGVDSIRAVRRFDEQTIADNAGLAFALILAGMEQLTATVLNLAHIIEKG